MYTALIIDDEPDAISVLRRSLELFCPAFSTILEARDGAQARACLQRHNVDLTFLDIRLKRESGLTLYREIDNLCPNFVFVSAYDEYAVKAFKTEALHYLLKPVEPAELEKAVARANLAPTRITISNTAMKIPIDYKNILYLKSDGPYTTFYTLKKKPIVIAYTLKYFQRQIKSPDFFRVHRSFFINLKHVNQYSSKELTMVDGTSIPIAKRQFKAFEIAFNGIQ